MRGESRDTFRNATPEEEATANREKTPFEILEEKEGEIINLYWKIAREGSSEDNVREKALKTMWGKLRPDRTRHEIAGDITSPYEKLEKAMRELEKKDKAGDDLK